MDSAVRGWFGRFLLEETPWLVLAQRMPAHSAFVTVASRGIGRGIAEDRFPFSTGAVFDVDGGFHLHRL